MKTLIEKRVEELKAVKEERVQEYKKLNNAMQNSEKLLESINSRIDELEFILQQKEHQDTEDEGEKTDK